MSKTGHLFPSLVTALVTGLLAAHVFKWEMLRVDNTTLILLGLLAAIPYLGRIVKIRVGDLEADMTPPELGAAPESGPFIVNAVRERQFPQE